MFVTFTVVTVRCVYFANVTLIALIYVDYVVDCVLRTFTLRCYDFVTFVTLICVRLYTTPFYTFIPVGFVCVVVTFWILRLRWLVPTRVLCPVVRVRLLVAPVYIYWVVCLVLWIAHADWLFPFTITQLHTRVYTVTRYVWLPHFTHARYFITGARCVTVEPFCTLRYVDVDYGCIRCVERCYVDPVDFVARLLLRCVDARCG